MDRRIVIALTAVLAATALAQSPSPQPNPLDERWKLMQQYVNGAPNGTWKQITDDVRLLVFKTDGGDYRGRLYVKIGETWQPVAAEGREDLMRVLPAR